MASMIMSESALGAQACAMRMNIVDYKWVNRASDLRVCADRDTLVLSGHWFARHDNEIVLAMAKRKGMKIIHAS